MLIVDDNDVNRRILAEQVRRWGMTATVVATDGSRRSGAPAFLLVDEHAGHGRFEVAAEIAGRRHGHDAELVRRIRRSVRRLGIAIAVRDLLARSNARSALAAHDGRPLLVEDNVVNQRVASGLLTRRGHHVTVAQDGREALARLDQETFDLVLMDLQMPVMGGLDATVAIRLRERVTGQHVRIVAMTAHAMSSDRERCLAAGMDGYLSKPIDPPMLFAVVEQDGDGGGGVQTAVAGPVTFDEDALRHRLSGDDELMTDVIRVFLEDLPVRLAAIKDAVTGRNADALRAAAHALKGAAGNLSAGGLFEAAQRARARRRRIAHGRRGSRVAAVVGRSQQRHRRVASPPPLQPRSHSCAS